MKTRAAVLRRGGTPWEAGRGVTQGDGRHRVSCPRDADPAGVAR